MTINATVTSTQGFETDLPDWLVNGAFNSPDATTAGTFIFTNSTDELLGGPIEIRFLSDIGGTGDFTYSGQTPTGGTITGIEIVALSIPQTVLTLTGLNLDFNAIFSAMSITDAFGLSQLVFDSDGFVFQGDVGDDTFSVRNKASELNGGDGNDTLISLSGDDVLNGDNGDDVLIGGFSFGNGDVLDGGDGFDTASYVTSSTVISVNLATGEHLGDAFKDTYIDIEKIVGSDLDDTLIADGSSIQFDGGKGNDDILGGDGDNWINGGEGIDNLDGGGGKDTLSFIGAAAGVTVTIGAAGVQTTGKGGDAAGDTYKNFENIVGGSGNDALTGNNDANVIVGGDGIDALKGLSGNDRLIGLGGSDNLAGGAGNDNIQGGADTDTLAGGAGIDLLDYDLSNAAVTVTLGNGNTTTVGKGGDAEGDKISQFENLHGSNFDDILTGNKAANIFLSGAGADTMTGGGGNDVVTYANSGDKVSIDLAAASQKGGDAEGDKIVNIATIIGSSLDDEIKGAGGNDMIDGGNGADTLSGGGGTDFVNYANSGNGVAIDLSKQDGVATQSGGDAAGDILTGFEGVIGSEVGDFLTGSAAADIIIGGAGDDEAEGAQGADTLDGGAGIDQLSFASSAAGITVTLGANGAQSIGAGAGSDALGDKIRNFENLYGSGVNDKFTGNNLANKIDGSNGDDVINGAGGDDTLIGETGKDTILGGAGNDTIFGNDGDDTIDGGAGNDIIQAGDNADKVTGGAGNDVVEGNFDADQLDGGAGIDTLSYRNSSVAVEIILGAPNVNATGTGGDAEGDQFKNFENVLGSAFNDKITGNSGANVIDSGAGQDTVDGGAGIDTVSYATAAGDLNVTLGEAGVASMFNGWSGNQDTIVNFENILGSKFSDTLEGNSGANTIDGNDLHDTLRGFGGNDTLKGGAGDDLLIGGAGKDVLDGGADNDLADYQDFNGGNITIALGKNGAASIVKALAGTAPAGDTLKNVEDVWGGKGDDTLTGNALANIIHGGDGDDLIQGGSEADSLFGDGNAANNASLNDTLSYSQSKAGVTVTIHNPTVFTSGMGGDAHGDVIVNFENLIGSAHSDFLRSFATNQINTIKGGGGDDIIEGYSGSDSLSGEAGLDTLSYAQDNVGVTVTLMGAGAADVSGSTGAGNHAKDDLATGFENLVGGGASDKLIGDAGANVIDGGGNADFLDGGGGLNDSVSYASAGSSGLIVVLGADGAMTTGNGTGSGAENDTIQNFEHVIGSAFSDKLFGNNLANKLYGMNADDTLIGGGGADILDGGDGLFDVADYSAVGADKAITVTFGAAEGQANVTGTAPDAIGDKLFNMEHVKGGMGADVFKGNAFTNRFTGNDGDDVMEGGAGGDVLNGGNGNDTISYASSDAGVTVHLGGGFSFGGHAGDAISSIENFIGSKFDDRVVGNDDDNVMAGGAGNDSLEASLGADTMDGGAGIDFVKFENQDDVAITIALGSNGAESAVNATGVNAAIANGDKIRNIENILGGNGNDILTGNALNNHFIGGGGDDILEGGAGNDTLNGFAGNDTASYAGATKGVTVNLTKTSPQNTVGAGTDHLAAIDNILGSAKNDRLTGNHLTNTLDGGLGDDIIIGHGNNDILIGGGGNDTVSYEITNSSAGVTVDLGIQDGVTAQGVQAGDANGDILSGFENLTGTSNIQSDKLTGDGNANIIKGLDGSDTIEGGGGADTLDGGVGAFDTVSYSTSGDDVTLTLGTNGALTIATGGTHAQGDKVSNFENITGGMGKDVLTGNNLDNTIKGGAGDDILKGAAGNDHLEGGDNDDIIEGGAGDDYMDGGAGIDTLTYTGAAAGVTIALNSSGAQNTGGAGTDTVIGFENFIGSSKNDAILSTHGAMLKVDGGAGDDVIANSSGADVVIGGAGNDVIKACQGAAETLDGGTGTDTLDFSTFIFSVTIDLNIQDGVTAQSTDGLADDILTGFENVIGGTTADQLTGDGANNRLEGRSNADTLSGGGGNDTLVGGIGSDTLTGGAGNDRFLYNSESDGHFNEHIADFTSGQDKLVIDKDGFTNMGNTFKLVSGAMPVATNGVATFLYDTDTGALLYDPDGTGAASDVEIAILDGAPTLLLSDFLLV